MIIPHRLSHPQTRHETPHLTLPDPGGRRHDVHADWTLQLFPGRVNDLRELVVLACAVTLVWDRPLPQAGPAAVAHGLAAGQLDVRLERGTSGARPAVTDGPR